jgi:hypothetical protein
MSLSVYSLAEISEGCKTAEVVDTYGIMVLNGKMSFLASAQTLRHCSQEWPLLGEDQLTSGI